MDNSNVHLLTQRQSLLTFTFAPENDNLLIKAHF